MLFCSLSAINDPEDSTKYEQVYLRYRDQMMRIALNILKNNHHDAEDAVHDAFVRLTGHIQDLPAPESERTKKYVYQMARNAAIDIYRKRYGNKATLSLEELFEYPSDTDIPTEYADHEIYQHFVTILENMPPHYRDVLSLYWLDGKKPAKIAAILNRPIQTVNKQLRRGNKLLFDKTSKEAVIHERA